MAFINIKTARERFHSRARERAWLLSFCLILVLVSPLCNASFIESSIGTAIVEDATATYFNPSTLAFLKKKQIVGLGSLGYPESVFKGQTTDLSPYFNFSGQANIQSRFILPSLYFTSPFCSKWALGLAVIANDVVRDIDSSAIIGEAHSDNRVKTLDFIGALAYRFNKYVSVGASLNRAHAYFLFEPIAGFPNEEKPDFETTNESSGDCWSWDIGFLLKPTRKWMVGFNHRSAMTFDLHGKSSFHGSPPLISNDFHYKFWIPTRSVLSVSYDLCSAFEIMGTAHYIQWSIFKNINFFNLASQTGIILSNDAPFFYHNSWLFTAGGKYRLSKKLLVRIAASYLQTPSNGKFQIDNGDSITLGASMAYTLLKNFVLDFGYSHAFVRPLGIAIANPDSLINGSTKGKSDAIALKLTMTI